MVLLVGAALSSCGGANLPGGEAVDTGLMIQNKPTARAGVRVFEDDEVVAEFRTRLSLRFVAPFPGHELRNLPRGWSRIAFERRRGSFEVTPDTEFSALAPMSCRWTGLIIYALFGLWLVLMVGLSGGPIHGDQPMMFALIHLIVSWAVIAGWQWVYFAAYLALSLALVALGVGALAAVTEERKRTPVRIAIVLVLAALFGVLLTGPDYRPRARWASRNSVQLFVPQDQRGTVTFLDSEGSTLLVDDLAPVGPSHVVYYWPGAETPVEVKLRDRIVKIKKKRPSD